MLRLQFALLATGALAACSQGGIGITPADDRAFVADDLNAGETDLQLPMDGMAIALDGSQIEFAVAVDDLGIPPADLAAPGDLAHCSITLPWPHGLPAPPLQFTRHATNLTAPLYQIIYTARGYIAGGRGTVAQSDDGLTWRVGTLPHATCSYNPCFVLSLASTGSRVVALQGPSSPNTLWWTDDGIVWQPTNTGGLSVSSVAASPTRFVAVDFSDTVYASDDAVTWRAVSLPVAGRLVDQVLWTGTQFLASGPEPTQGAGVTIFSSSDGLNWTFQPAATAALSFAPDLFLSGEGPSQIAGNSLLQVAGFQAPHEMLWYEVDSIASTDGVCWVRLPAGPCPTSGFAGDYYGVLGKELVLTCNSQMLISVDSVTWTPAQFGDGGTYPGFSAITGDGPRIVALGGPGDV
jgi:hypothetical protein